MKESISSAQNAAPIVSADPANHPMTPAEAFSEIGKLMSTWVALLPVRDTEYNKKITLEFLGFGRKPMYERSTCEQARMRTLQTSLISVRSVAVLKRTLEGVGPVIAGSAKMDTGAAFQLIGSQANFSLPEDVLVSDKLLALVYLARPMSGSVFASTSAAEETKPRRRKP